MHLHPLTLEDILQREPREKLEVFPKLGYYFISFRAIDSQAQQEARPGSRQAEGPVGESNIYVVVFQEGVCTVNHLGCAYFSQFIADTVPESFIIQTCPVSFAFGGRDIILTCII